MKQTSRDVPVLFTTYNRLEYSKRALEALIESECGQIIVVDNFSTDGTREWLESMKEFVTIILQEKNTGVAGAMNIFLQQTSTATFVGKVDNDTVVKQDWCSRLLQKLIDCRLHIVQAKHPILAATHTGGDFDAWMRTMQRDRKDHSIFYNRFVGGSGIVFRRNIIDAVPETEWKLYGWNKFQKEHPELKKAFCTEVEIELLDMFKEGCSDYSKYPEYYKETRRT